MGVGLKLKQNQGLSTFDFLVMFVSLAVVLVICIPILQKNMEGGNIDKAKQEAERLALGLIQDGGVSLRLASQNKTDTSRSIASVGKEITWSGNLGKDPWGQPFQYRFLKNKNGAPVQIVVWSSGPGKVNQAPRVSVSAVSGVEELQFDQTDVVLTKLSVR